MSANERCRQLKLDSFFPSVVAKVCFVRDGGFLDPTPWLDCDSLLRLSMCSCTARKQVGRLWASWRAALEGVDLAYLEQELGSLFDRHRDKIRRVVCKIRSAADLYECWPSTHWFHEAALPFADHLDFEFGDSSYNVWIFDIQEALPLLGRIVCDLYLRSIWPRKRSGSRSGFASPDREGFVRAAAAAARTADERKRRDRGAEDDEAEQEEGEDGGAEQGGGLFFENWELQMRPAEQLMRQIWWDAQKLSSVARRGRAADWQKVLQRRPWLSQGLLLPRRPQPEAGLSLLYEQESVFFAWDRFELWVYGCYVD
mmetsp:Transcript_35596/g.84965  ORF Transcript_35596/g.84965 Transcript_35596/m.84965 type:complete len:313 (+) Transcript_35596:28-966(+)